MIEENSLVFHYLFHNLVYSKYGHYEYMLSLLVYYMMN